MREEVRTNSETCWHNVIRRIDDESQSDFICVSCGKRVWNMTRLQRGYRHDHTSGDWVCSGKPKTDREQLAADWKLYWGMSDPEKDITSRFNEFWKNRVGVGVADHNYRCDKEGCNFTVESDWEAEAREVYAYHLDRVHNGRAELDV